MAVTMTTTTTEEIKLKPLVAKKLKLKLGNYASLAKEIKALKAAQVVELEAIEAIRADTGAFKFEFEGAKITRIEGTHKKLNHKTLIQLGCAAAWITQATEEHPKRAYTKITLPGEKDYGDD